ncbi:hypothetical protein B0T16DRAFT_70940 [Cercophora newfieldiana]|uniref:Secreted protein n=1 Tax=Cercophora newfieldiana TaxID=92897 RepID=A0AA39YST0_9PEZI|nr:hypothetical protein B0T16DRAFT_70940 [Cercophora newfieldiana]
MLMVCLKAVICAAPPAPLLSGEFSPWDGWHLASNQYQYPSTDISRCSPPLLSRYSRSRCALEHGTKAEHSMRDLIV